MSLAFCHDWLCEVPGVTTAWPSLRVHPPEFSHPFYVTLGSYFIVFSYTHSHRLVISLASTWCLQVLAVLLGIYLVFRCGACGLPCISWSLSKKSPVFQSTQLCCCCYIIIITTREVDSEVLDMSELKGKA